MYTLWQLPKLISKSKYDHQKIPLSPPFPFFIIIFIKIFVDASNNTKTINTTTELNKNATTEYYIYSTTYGGQGLFIDEEEEEINATGRTITTKNNNTTTEMSKRRIDETTKDWNAHPWAMFKVDSKGLVKDIHIDKWEKLRRGLEDEQHQEISSITNTTAPTVSNIAIEATMAPEKLRICQGERLDNFKHVPIPHSESPPDSISGFRSITLHAIQDWDNGIDKEIIDFLNQASLLVQKSSEEDRKFRLGIFLAYAFEGHQAATFGKNLAQLFSISRIQDSIGAFSYSEGGHLAELLARFSILNPDPKFLYRYDVHVYCENETLVEDYYADVEHWLDSQWGKPPSSDSHNHRQVRLKFVPERKDTADIMIDLLKKYFYKAVSPYADKRTFIIRLDCPGFSLEPFHIENTNTTEIMAMEFKHEQVLGDFQDIEDFEEEEPVLKKTRSASQIRKHGEGEDEEGGGENIQQQKPGKSETGTTEPSNLLQVPQQKEPGTYGENNNSNNNNVVDEEEKIVWRSYKLVRAPDGNELERLMEGQLPLLKRTLNIVH